MYWSSLWLKPRPQAKALPRNKKASTQPTCLDESICWRNIRSRSTSEDTAAALFDNARSFDECLDRPTVCRFEELAGFTGWAPPSVECMSHAIPCFGIAPSMLCPELEASSQTQTQTLHLPGLDMSNWFWAGRLHLNKHKKPRARPSPNLEKGSTQPKLARRVHLFRIRGIYAKIPRKKTRGLEPNLNPNLAPAWSRQVHLVQGVARPQARLHLNKYKKPRARPSPNLAPSCSSQVRRTSKKTGAIRVRENPKPVKVEARVERQRGWARANRGVRLGASSTSAPLIETPLTLNPTPF